MSDQSHEIVPIDDEDLNDANISQVDITEHTGSTVLTRKDIASADRTPITDEEIEKILHRRAQFTGWFMIVILFVTSVYLALGHVALAYAEYPDSVVRSTLYGSGNTTAIYIIIGAAGIFLSFIPAVLYLLAKRYPESSVIAVSIIVVCTCLGMVTHPMAKAIHSNAEVLSCVKSVDPAVADEIVDSERALTELQRPGEPPALISRSHDGILSLSTITGQEWSCSAS